MGGTTVVIDRFVFLFNNKYIIENINNYFHKNVKPINYKKHNRLPDYSYGEKLNDPAPAPRLRRRRAAIHQSSIRRPNLKECFSRGPWITSISTTYGVWKIFKGLWNNIEGLGMCFIQYLG